MSKGKLGKPIKPSNTDWETRVANLERYCAIDNGKFKDPGVKQMVKEMRCMATEIDQLKTELSEAKRNLDHWWRRGLSAECRIEELEDELESDQ